MYLGIVPTVAVVCVLAVCFAFLLKTNLGRRVVAAVDAVAERRVIGILACSALAMVGSALVSVFVRWPEPAVHDEFSYLLAADTFASGRLSNPVHDLWHHFETFYVLHQPSYASRFPPAQGLILAMGMVVGGSPVVGLWLSAAAMAGAICWALYGFVSPRWALLGGIAAVCQIGITTYWAQSFWGGALSAAAGALVFGSTVRLADRGGMRDAVLLGVGLVLLANTRPFEGAVLAVAPSFFLLAALVRGRLVLRSLFPTIVLGLVGLVCMGVYNHAVVGRWWAHPYMEYERQYLEKPIFVVQGETEAKSYRHDVLRDFFHREDPKPVEETLNGREGERPGRFSEMRDRFAQLRVFFLRRLLLFPFLIGCAMACRSRAGRLAMSGVLATAAALLFSQYFRIHYASVVAAPVYALTAMGFERIAGFRLGRWPAGTALGTAILACVFLSAGIRTTRVPAFYESKGYSQFAAARNRVIERLAQEPGRDLVIVGYTDGHSLHREWVYNRADIDGSQIVWARDMGAVRNAALLEYFADRRVWTLNVGAFEEVIGPEPLGSATGGSDR